MRATPAAVIAVMVCVVTTTALLLNPLVTRAQDTASSPPQAQGAASLPPGDYVSRAEYDKLKVEHEAMKRELEALKTAVGEMAGRPASVAPAEGSSPAATPSEGEQVAATTTSPSSEGKQVATATTPPSSERKQVATAITPPSTEAETVPAELSGPLATHSFSIVGDAEFQFGKIDGQHGAFMLSDFAPIFLFRGGDKILFEAGFDFIIQNNAPGGSGYTTTVNLSFATLDYLINDYITFVGGNMLLPLGTYSERSAAG